MRVPFECESFARMSVREHRALLQIRSGKFVGGAFDHEDVVFRSDVNQIEIAVSSLIVGWIRNELTVYAANADCTMARQRNV